MKSFKQFLKEFDGNRREIPNPLSPDGTLAKIAAYIDMITHQEKAKVYIRGWEKYKNDKRAKNLCHKWTAKGIVETHFNPSNRILLMGDHNTIWHSLLVTHDGETIEDSFSEDNENNFHYVQGKGYDMGHHGLTKPAFDITVKQFLEHYYDE